MGDGRHVYKEVEIVNDGLLSGRLKEPSLVTISYDEKPGIQAIANTTPDLPAVPGKHPSVTRDYEYVRHGTVSLLAGINLHTGQITEMVSETHKSKDFVEYLQKLDAAYPETAVIRLVLENSSAHISKETRRYLATPPQRVIFGFTPTPAASQTPTEGLLSK